MAATRQAYRRIALACCLAASLGLGCSSTHWARMRRMPRNPLTVSLGLNSWKGPRPTDSTMQFLRQYDLTDRLDNDPEGLVAEMQQIAAWEGKAEQVYALAEIAYIAAKRREAQGRTPQALDLFGAAVANAYVYLFDERFAAGRNEYDPRFRGACDLYNASLESALRYLSQIGMLRPGAQHVVRTARQHFHVSVATRGTWHEDHFQELKFASDYDVRELRNEYRSYGLGVPMIAVYRSTPERCPADRFYPPGMSFPVTAFLRVFPPTAHNGIPQHHCLIELHDSTRNSQLEVEGRTIPLEVDLTTPLAYSLDNPAFREANEPIKGLRNPRESTAVSGIYLLEPYQKGKIPVVMVHGFWSSLVTWMEMFNDLRGNREIRDHFQFWFYLYPTGQPFWCTAAHLRDQLALVRQQMDPSGRTPALDQTVLIGHSAGGLISTLQTLESGDAFWKLVSPYPIETLNATPEIRQNLHKTFFFHPDKSVNRVITIATPHRGSNSSNQTTQWLSTRLISLPDSILQARASILRDNKGRLAPNTPLAVSTNVAALAPDSAFLRQMQVAPRSSWVTYHNVMGKIQKQKLLSAVAADSDGVVTLASADQPNAASQLIVDAAHSQVHQHPRTILEVKRILLQHLREQARIEYIPPPPVPSPLPPPAISRVPAKEPRPRIQSVTPL